MSAKTRAPSTVTRPLFVIGTGRCGLSPVMDLLTAHEGPGLAVGRSTTGGSPTVPRY